MPSAFRSALRALLPARWRRDHPLVAVVRLSGPIGAVSPLRQGLSLGTCAPALERAFGLPGLKAVALVINSPGGSAAQSHLIHHRIRALAEEKKLPVLAFVEDVAASGGYMIACAADEIVADPSSLVGSIGVVSAGFGFQGLLERLGVERRVHTTGPSKAMLDPFRPEDPADVARLKGIQADIQALFTDLVRARRPSLSGEPADLFSGAVWSGRQALALGLVDALGDLRGVLRARYGDKVEIRVVEQVRGGLLARLLRRREPGAEGLALVEGALAVLEERAAYARFGL
ncbi:peptidase S49 [Methylobacterium sp. 4-46]|uniref:S49 family peptidase n=1 Tax=unclassified Methylobacterium TaxID=2615210 RepID=UPI000152DE81|nr:MULTISPECIES: S49 family peptidase [Methylobacterium]ACA17195.1 peptidase S49 [Methylobacterium sp. 4-46]WFT82877.1 S49 family peptidase [Methylobacterium nodulans]